MAETVVLDTARLTLRQWREEDLPLFAKINTDPQVMEYFPAVLSTEESDALARRCQMLIDQRGWGLWALELATSQEFAGFVGLHVPGENLPCSPCVEIGWRLGVQHWGRGYASEAARKALDFGFTNLKLDQIVSFTTRSNLRSRAVMERIGLTNTENNFTHPDIAPDHPLSAHVLYSLAAGDWR